MEHKGISIKQIIIKYGLLLTILNFVIFGISYVIDNYIDPPWWISLLGVVITIIVLVYGFKAYKYRNNDFMSYGKALKIGLGISLITGVIMGVFRYLFITVIEPDFVRETVELFKVHHPDVLMNIEEGKGMMQASVMSIIEFLSTSFLGLFITLIVGLIIKKSKVD